MNIGKQYTNYINRFIPEHNFANSDTYYQSFLLLSAHILSTIFLLTFSSIHFILTKNITEAYILLSTAIIFIISFFIYKKNGNNKFTGNLIISVTFIGFIIIAYGTGGIYAPVIPWLTSISISGFLLVNKRYGFFWTSLNVFAIILFSAFEYFDIFLNTRVVITYNVLNYGPSLLGSSIYIILIILSYEILNNKKTQQLESLLVINKEKQEEIYQQQEELTVTLEGMSKINKRIEKQKQKYERMSIVASETTNAIIIMDADGRFEWVNSGFVRQTGMTLRELIKNKGKTIIEAHNNEDYITDCINTVLKQKITVSFDEKQIYRDGVEHYSKVTLTPMIENSKIKKIISISTDITDLIENEKKIIKQQEELKIQKEQIEGIHYDLTQSIDYAQRLQRSILPSNSILEKHLSDNFVLYKPKDKVSGDFYWWTNVLDSTVIAAADSTGHGVPGAFMSMLGTSFLREIVQKEYITHTGVILRKLRKEIIKLLKQKGELGEQKDGMDMAIISIDHTTNIVQFSGANNPLYILTNQKLDSLESINGFDNFYIIEPDKMPIAIYDIMDNFTMHEIQLQKGDQLYMFSDGFVDQFGGPRDKKFKYKQFKQLLHDNRNTPMNNQQEQLNKAFEDWRGSNEQIDDVLVLGVKL